MEFLYPVSLVIKMSEKRVQQRRRQQSKKEVKSLDRIEQAGYENNATEKLSGIIESEVTENIEKKDEILES
jgi:hypothetical protein